MSAAGGRIVKIMVQGSGFSGSGAVLDWLRDAPEPPLYPVRIRSFEPIARPDGSPTMAMRILGLAGIHRPGPWLADLLRTADPVARAAIVRETVRRMRRLRVAWPLLTGPRAAWRLAGEWTGLRPAGVHRSTVRNEDARDWQVDLRFLTDAVVDAAYWQQWLDARIRQRCGDVAHVLLDKGLPFPAGVEQGWHRIFEPFRMILVDRDPADQLAECVRQRRLSLSADRVSDDEAVASLLTTVREHLLQTEAYCREAPASYRAVAFEDFVLRHEDTAHSLRAWLGVGEETSATGHHFVPAESARNIGIAAADDRVQAQLQRHAETVAEIRAIRARLREQVT